MIETTEKFFVFDVESIGLYGEGFAVGWVVTDRALTIFDQGVISIAPEFAMGTKKDHQWIQDNVLCSLPSPTISIDYLETFWFSNSLDANYFKAETDLGLDYYQSFPQEILPFILRSRFWDKIQEWNAPEVSFWGDCIYPVETNFLAACVEDRPSRMIQAPYPLNEIATVLRLARQDPLKDYARLDRELPKHHPTKDSLQSARLLVENLNAINLFCDRYFQTLR